MIRGLLQRNPLDRALKKLVKEEKSRILVVWNRGLGDIPLGIYAFCHRVREFIPHASITVLTRENLAEGFSLLKGVTTLVASNWVRGKPLAVKEALQRHQLAPNMFDIVFEWIDIMRWLRWQLGTLTPKLLWKEEWNELSEKFELERGETYIGAQLQTETSRHYDRNRDWPLACWRDLFRRILAEKKGKIILLGLKSNPAFLMDGVIDLRGKTSVLEMLSLIKSRCTSLLVPDSGVLSMVYYLEATFPLEVISLWGSSKQGVLRQNVPSPNRKLNHIPLIGAHKDITQISIDAVYEALFCRKSIH